MFLQPTPLFSFHENHSAINMTTFETSSPNNGDENNEHYYCETPCESNYTIHYNYSNSNSFYSTSPTFSSSSSSCCSSSSPLNDHDSMNFEEESTSTNNSIDGTNDNSGVEFMTKTIFGEESTIFSYSSPHHYSPSSSSFQKFLSIAPITLKNLKCLTHTDSCIESVSSKFIANCQKNGNDTTAAHLIALDSLSTCSCPAKVTLTKHFDNSGNIYFSISCPICHFYSHECAENGDNPFVSYITTLNQLVSESFKLWAHFDLDHKTTFEGSGGLLDSSAKDFCRVCSSSISSKKHNRRRHYFTHLLRVFLYICPVCDTRFKFRSDIKKDCCKRCLPASLTFEGDALHFTRDPSNPSILQLQTSSNMLFYFPSDLFYLKLDDSGELLTVSFFDESLAQLSEAILNSFDF